MRLKWLEILGFKSFADKTRLEFNAGITAVVGPNGCGKSNIADAFRWVMGEQSAKSLRGSKMPDVIFAGTSQRKPLNFAEVTITLTDIEGMLPVIYDEVAITRRLHRSGESEYFINRHPVRLKDIQSLLLDTGLGKDAYSVFEQGEIDRVINLPPLERRYIFEEAAGILRFLQRKKEALRKLEQTDLNVTRIKDIHHEVEKQIIVLEQQAEKAREYKENRKVLDQLEKALLVSKWDGIQTRLKDTQTKTQGIEQQIATANKQLETLQIQIQEAKQALAEADKILQGRREEVFKTRSSKEVKSKEKQNHEERLKELLAKEKRWQQEIENIHERRRQRETEQRTVLSEQQELEKRQKEQEKVVQAQREKVSKLEGQLQDLREEFQHKQKDSFKCLQTEAQCDNDIRQSHLRLENAQERQNLIQERQTKLLHTAQESNKQAEENKHLLEEKIRAVEEQKKLFTAIDKDLHEIAEDGQKVQADIDQLSQETNEAKARQKALQRLREDLEGFSNSSKKLLQENADPQSPLFGKISLLYEYFNAEKMAETALAAAMKPYAQTLVVATEADFNHVVTYAKKHKLNDISLLCLESIAKIKPQKSKAFDKDWSPLAVHLVENELSKHFLKETYLASSSSLFDVMKVGSGIEVCLQDGAYVDHKAVVFYFSQGENNVFLREAELKALAKLISSQEAEKHQREEILRAIHQKRNQLQTEKLELDKTIRRGEMQLVELNFALNKITSDLGKIKSETQSLTLEKQNVDKTIEEQKHILEALKKKHEQAKELAASAQKYVQNLNVQLTSFQIDFKQQSQGLQEREASLQNILDEIRKRTHALHVIEVKNMEGSQQEKHLQAEIEMGQVLQGQITLKGKEVSQLLHEVEHSLAAVSAACAELEQQVSKRKNILENFENKVHEKYHTLKKFEQDRQQTSIQMAQLEAQAHSLENELKERHQATIAEGRQQMGAISQTSEQLEKQLRALRQQVESAGDINMTSIEECDKHKVRYQFLNQQIDDMNITRQELVSIITQLDSESRKIFKDTFEKINANFKKNFKVLFNGGEADLQFTESADLLEAGIEIIAKPPGKQMRSIHLLSGGEKCLTAMALLFAIFEVRPAPFCILDEIDAPLDDTNVERFANIIKLFTDRCQFIIITHNKRTMSIADVLFGVSMEEKGVSKLLTMEFAKSLVEA